VLSYTVKVVLLECFDHCSLLLLLSASAAPLNG